MIQSFEKRVPPGYLFGIPKPAVLPIAGSFCLALGVVVAEAYRSKLIFALGLIYLIYLSYEIWRNYQHWLVKSSLKFGQKLSDAPTFGAKNTAIYADYFGWKTGLSLEPEDTTDSNKINCLIHHEGAVSLAFVWDGIHNRYFSDADFRREHLRRVTLLKQFANKHGLFIENHLLRRPDSRLVESYEREGKRLFKGLPPPPIITKIREGIADIARQYGRSNQLLTVISMGNSPPTGVMSWLLPQVARRNKKHIQLGNELLKVYQQIQRDFSGSRLLCQDEYQQWIQAILNPFASPREVNWRFALNEQLITNKPQWDSDMACLSLDGTYYKVCLLQGYPDMDHDWVLPIAEAGIDLHICQILKPKNTQKALDNNRKISDTEQGASNEKKSLESLAHRLKDMSSFRQYVVNHGLDVWDNAYIVTFCCRDKVMLNEAYWALKRSIDQGGFLRAEQDLQLEMFRVRLPGLGRNSLFLREDHSDTVVAMMPFTTYPTGNPQPEMLRVSATGTLVGFAPSKVEVPHEMVVAETNGGKDTQFGMKIAETYPLIRYDIVELGNTYQGLVEAIGGHYCRAREQVINPLMAHSEFQSAIKTVSSLAKRSNVVNTTIASQILDAQVSILNPIFKGMKGGEFSRAESVVVARALAWVYENPKIASEAPTLPDVLRGLDQITLEKPVLVQAGETLSEALYLFMNGPSGSPFMEQDQFIISPIANAIDFDKFDGELADYFLSFMCVRLANSAFARGARSQIVLNEYKMLLEKSPEAIRWISLSIDRMGRKDWVGLSRISQGYAEIQGIDSESNSSIVNRTVLSRGDQHGQIGLALGMPDACVNYWQNFHSPKKHTKMNYREAFVCEDETWHHLNLRFPTIGLKLMNTSPENKKLREIAYLQSSDAFERIQILDRLMEERKIQTDRDNRKYEKMALV